MINIESVYYLIGALVCQGDTATYHPFWADEAKDEANMWQAFLALVDQYPMATIYHYRQYQGL